MQPKLSKITKMIRLNLPEYEINVVERDGKRMIFDFLRRKYVALTPEEWVRQHFTHFLVSQKGYPKTLLANEAQLQIGDKHLRCDTVLYDKALHPKIIVEYKAPEIAITQKVFNQITVYNMLLHVDYLIVSNGMQHYCCQMDYEQNRYTFLSDIPNYDQL